MKTEVESPDIPLDARRCGDVPAVNENISGRSNDQKRGDVGIADVIDIADNSERPLWTILFRGGSACNNRPSHKECENRSKPIWFHPARVSENMRHTARIERVGAPTIQVRP